MNTKSMQQKRQLFELSLPIKVLILMLGMVMVGLGMALMTMSDLGSDAITTLIYGISNFMRITVGMATTVLMIVFLVFAFFFNRKFIGLTTLFSVLFMGIFMDLFLYLARDLDLIGINMVYRVLLTLAGATILGSAIGTYLSLNLGSSPSDSVALWIKARLKVEYKYASWIFYAISLLLGWLLGGRIGLGTFLALLIVSPVADFFLKQFNPSLQK